MPCNGSAVFHRASHSDFEFAWQVRELRVQSAPLAQYFGVRAGVDRFVYRNASALVGGDVANAVAAGLNAVQIGSGQQVHHIGAFF